MKIDLQSLHELSELVKVCVGTADQQLVDNQIMYDWFISVLDVACSTVSAFSFCCTCVQSKMKLLLW